MLYSWQRRQFLQSMIRGQLVYTEDVHIKEAYQLLAERAFLKFGPDVFSALQIPAPMHLERSPSTKK